MRRSSVSGSPAFQSEPRHPRTVLYPMSQKKRGADVLTDALVQRGVERLFTLSGNQIMPIFDAAIDSQLDLLHVRHEASAVHMADCWGRLTGRPGVALVTAGPGMANCLTALYVAQMAESPLVLLSGHASTGGESRGAFQAMAQAQMAKPVTKASWTASSANGLSHDLERALHMANSGRPGPVHVALPIDLLEDDLSDASATNSDLPPQTDDATIDAEATSKILDALASAQRPLFLLGPGASRRATSDRLNALAACTHVPVVTMESPRGINDPSLGAIAEVLPLADVVVFLGKRVDFTLQVNGRPVFEPHSRWFHIDTDSDALQLAKRLSAYVSPPAVMQQADPSASVQTLLDDAQERRWPKSAWYEEVASAISHRPVEWQSSHSAANGPLHALDVCRAVAASLAPHNDAILVSDGGEFGQWAQACVTAPRRVINGPSGAIGGAIPFALAARLTSPRARVVAMLGDGTFGFHGLEFDTAVRYKLPFVAIVGNDATWNSEYQIQLRRYGAKRTVGCELLPSRYDEVVRALGGHGESVTSRDELPAALERAYASGLPACLNVALQRVAAPVIRRT